MQTEKHTSLRLTRTTATQTFTIPLVTPHKNNEYNDVTKLTCHSHTSQFFNEDNNSLRQLTISYNYFCPFSLTVIATRLNNNSIKLVCCLYFLYNIFFSFQVRPNTCCYDCGERKLSFQFPPFSLLQF